jgi:hypothetical protein
MTIQNSTFGFIDYFIADSRQRVPCQFFRSGKEMLARLDGGGAAPVLTSVSLQMHAEVLGSFPTVLTRYKAESSQVLAAQNFWHECEAGGAGALKLFQVVHHMRLFGATVSQAIDASIALAQKLRASEASAARAIYDVFCRGPALPQIDAARAVGVATVLQDAALSSRP